MKRELNEAFMQYDKFFVSIRDLRHKDEDDIAKKLKDGDITAKQAADQRKLIEEKATIDLKNLEIAYQNNVAAITKKFRDEELAKQKEHDKKTLEEAEKHVDALIKNLERLGNQQMRDKVAQAKIDVSKDGSMQNKLDEAKAEYNLDLQALNKQLNDKSISQTEYDEKMIELTQSYADKRKKIAEDEVNKVFAVYEKYGKAVEDLTTGLIENGYRRQENALQKLIEKNNRLKETETARITNSTLSEQEKANALLVLNARTEAQNEATQRKQNELKVKEAKLEKAKQILEIGVATAKAVATDLLQATVLAADPITAAFAPEAIAQAAIAGAVGAAQIAVVASKPIPTYFKGTEYHPGGPMIVGENGPELRIDPSGKMSVTPDKPTLMLADLGTKIIPNHKLDPMHFNEIALREILFHPRNNYSPVAQKQDNSEIISAIERVGMMQISAIKKNTPHIEIHNDHEFWAYIKRQLK